MNKIAFANICSAFSKVALGTKVVGNHDEAMAIIDTAISSAEFQENGQAFIVCPDLIPFVRSGDAPHTHRLADYHLAVYRGEVKKYLNSDYAKNIAVNFCALVVYTKEAYLLDPDVAGDDSTGIPRDQEEFDRISNTDCTHVIITVLASGGPKPAVTPHRFVMNLAGGNNDYKIMTGDELRLKALEVKQAYEAAWAMVADRE